MFFSLPLKDQKVFLYVLGVHCTFNFLDSSNQINWWTRAKGRGRSILLLVPFPVLWNPTHSRIFINNYRVAWLTTKTEISSSPNNDLLTLKGNTQGHVEWFLVRELTLDPRLCDPSSAEHSGESRHSGINHSLARLLIPFSLGHSQLSNETNTLTHGATVNERMQR